MAAWGRALSWQSRTQMCAGAGALTSMKTRIWDRCGGTAAMKMCLDIFQSLQETDKKLWLGLGCCKFTLKPLKVSELGWTQHLRIIVRMQTLDSQKALLQSLHWFEHILKMPFWVTPDLPWHKPQPGQWCCGTVCKEQSLILQRNRPKILLEEKNVSSPTQHERACSEGKGSWCLYQRWGCKWCSSLLAQATVQGSMYPMVNLCHWLCFQELFLVHVKVTISTPHHLSDLH